MSGDKPGGSKDYYSYTKLAQNKIKVKIDNVLQSSKGRFPCV